MSGKPTVRGKRLLSSLFGNGEILDLGSSVSFGQSIANQERTRHALVLIWITLGIPKRGSH